MSASQVSGARSVVRDFDQAFNLLTGSKSVHSAHDSLTTRGNATKRISGAKARAIGERLTGNDRQVIDVLRTVQLATGGQLRQLVWGDGESAARSARRQLAKLTSLRVVARLSYRPGGVRTGHDGFVYILDVVGQQVVSPGRPPRRPRCPSPIFIEHAVAVTNCYVVLKQLEARRQIELVHFDAEPNCWRQYIGRGGAAMTLRPDAFAITGAGDWEDRWFLEVDRGTEYPSRIRSKAKQYISYWQSGREQAQSDVFPKVLFVAPDALRVDQLVKTLSSFETDHWRLFQVTSAEQFADTIRAGAGESEVGS
jgi:hypothetical protein